MLAEQISKAISSLAVETHPETGRLLTVSAGIVARAPATSESAVDALLAADEALYEAKAAGRDRAVVRRL